MKLLVIAATSIELNAIKKGIKSANVKSHLNIDFLCTGVGNYETIFSLERYINICSEDLFIRNLGICGYRNKKNIKRTEPVQIASVINIHTKKEYVCPPFLKLASFGNCFSSENIVVNLPEFFNEDGLSDNDYFFDMESWGIEFIALKHRFPCVILKIPFDFVGNSVDLLNKGNYSCVGENISNLLTDLPYHDYLIKILGWMYEQNI